MDIQGEDVNKENFMAIMHGNLEALNLTNENSTAKVLKSDKNSKVLMFFSDHGAPGHIMFPTGALFADELYTTIHSMHSAQMYSEFLIFLEACESGSMFENMDLKGLNVWAMTATNSTSPSYGTYCYPHDIVND